MMAGIDFLTTERISVSNAGSGIDPQPAASARCRGVGEVITFRDYASTRFHTVRGVVPTFRSAPKSLTHLPQETSAAAVLHILKLNREAVRVGEVEFRRTAFGTAAVRHAERDVGHERIAALPFLLP